MVDIGKVTGQEVGINRDATEARRLMQVQITDDNDVQTAELMNPAGIDTNPVNGCLLTIVSGGRAWKIAIAANDGIAPSVDTGEIRIYCQVGGVIVSNVYCNKDGEVVCNDGTDYAVAFDDLKAAYDAFIIEYNAHTHKLVAPGGPTDVPIVLSTSSVDASKVPTVRVP